MLQKDIVGKCCSCTLFDSDLFWSFSSHIVHWPWRLVALRRVEAFIAQLAAFKTEAERRQSQQSNTTSLSTSAEDSDRVVGINELIEQDHSLEGPCEDGYVDEGEDGSSIVVIHTCDSGDTAEFGDESAPKEIASRKSVYDAHKPHPCRAGTAGSTPSDAGRHGDDRSSTVTELDRSTSSSRSTAATAIKLRSASLDLEEFVATSPSSTYSSSDVEVVKHFLAPSREATVLHSERRSLECDCMTTTMAGQNVTLEFLQSLSDTGKKEALQSAMAWCSTKELRTFCGGMGVRVRSKEYAAYQNKAGYTELLTQLLRAKSASKRSVVGPVPSPIVVAPVERTRKTKNCNLRLLNVLFSDKMAPYLSGMNAEPTQAEVAAGAVGGNNPFWTRFRAEFITSKAEYSQLAFQGPCLTGFNLTTPVSHSSTKLSEMWAELWEAYNSAIIRFSHSTEPNLEFADCCPSRSDVYYMRCWLGVKPNLLTEICAPLPGTVALHSEAPNSSESGNEGVVSFVAIRPAPVERVEHITRKRPRTTMTRMTRETDPAATSETQNKDVERAFLMKSIRHAAEVLTIARRSDLGPEVEETVRCELQQCTKRLKRIQQEEKEEIE